MTKEQTDRKRAQHTEQAMRDKRDRETQERTPGPGEPRFRDGVDRGDLGDEGWEETNDVEAEPKGGFGKRPSVDVEQPSPKDRG